MKIIGIAGSVADQSYNRMLLAYISDHFQDLFELEIVDISRLPLFSSDHPEWTEEGPIHTVVRKILQADGVIIATPEHNHTVPTPLKSLLEWLSFKVHPLKNKPVKILGASYLDQGTSRAQLHLRQNLEAPGIDALVMPGQEFLLGHCQTAFDSQGNLLDQGTISYLREVLTRFTKYVEAVQPLVTDPVFPKEDLLAQQASERTVTGVDMTDPDWLNKASDRVQAVSGDTYVELAGGLLTVDQINELLASLPLAVTYIDENNQFLYSNQPEYGSNFEDLGSPLGLVDEENCLSQAKEYIGQLRSGNQAKLIISNQNKLFTYVALHDQTGKYRGFSQQVLTNWPGIELTNQNMDATNPLDDSDSGVENQDMHSLDSQTSPSQSQVSDQTTNASQNLVTDQNSGASQLPASDADTGASQH
ncbi:hypothetical protein AWM75_01440 [Aerococcus urinaehominis]|uniref:Uncharacterized protein n=1 Tax=Aerococcus urinaehominis TaxID=128944 RepID=A0A109RGF0_9LACT|nr:NAD(P)H-dependent oxidoreductase [Aerococcus urinaehominis]AMB98739.1 hypothetical protein AWM75_01440 [Aerococcus urinaehominis]SDM63167.1 NAD(P)H-dependent FMN reductase [Aerococcus urinaehominis]